MRARRSRQAARPTARLVVSALVGCLVALLPTSAAPSRALAPGAPCRAGQISLTFDDGPSATVTPRLVAILKKAQVPATFFMVGERVVTAPVAAELVAKSGFLIANHTYAHADLTAQTSEAIASTLRTTDAALRRAGTQPTGLMRPPYGAINDRVRGAIRRAGYVPVLWDVDSRDWQGGSTATIAASILGQLRPHRSNVVLQHDGVRNSPASIAAVPLVVAEARRRGYCFTALDELGRPGFPTPTASLSVTHSRVPEGKRMRWQVRLDEPTARDTTLGVQLRSRVTGKVVATVAMRLAAGRTSLAGSFPIPRDGRDERAERVDLTLVDLVGLRRAAPPKHPAHASVVILDRDRAPSVFGEDRTVREPATEPTTINVRLRLSSASGKSISVLLETRPGTAGAADVVAERTRVRLPPGARSFVVPVVLLPDEGEGGSGEIEAEETFRVVPVRAHHARLGAAAVVTIRPYVPGPTPVPPVPSRP